MKVSPIEEELAFLMKIKDIDQPIREYCFHPSRKWRFDFAWVGEMVAVECEGGQWIGGRHTRPTHFDDQCEKYAEAAVMGWAVLRFTPKMIKNGVATEMIERALKIREKNHEKYFDRNLLDLNVSAKGSSN